MPPEAISSLLAHAPVMHLPRQLGLMVLWLRAIMVAIHVVGGKKGMEGDQFASSQFAEAVLPREREACARDRKVVLRIWCACPLQR